MSRMWRVAVLLCISVSARAGDWPQILGPDRSGRAAGDEKITATFAADGPRIVWKMKVGQGLAGPAVAGGRLVLFHRLDGRETVGCLDALSGAPLWRFDYPTDYRDDFGFDEGPRAVPAIDVHAGRVYTHGAGGMVHALDLATGMAVWAVDTARTVGSRKGFFGRACSPLADGPLVIVQVGGTEGAGIVAFDSQTGQVKWKATDDEAGYSSPVAATVGGRRMILAWTREALVGLDPADGRILFRKPFRASLHASVNAASPIVIDDSVLLTASYSVGAARWRIGGRGLTQLWANDTSLSSQYTTPVPHGDFLYGLHGRQDVPPRPMLRCIEAATGDVRWSTPPLAAGAIIIADEKLIVLTEDGELILAPASPQSFSPTARVQVLGSNTRALPALSNGYLYARDPRQLICVDLRRDPQP
jgi:outer membrane protein assembly factor BamB